MNKILWKQIIDEINKNIPHDLEIMIGGDVYKLQDQRPYELRIWCGGLDVVSLDGKYKGRLTNSGSFFERKEYLENTTIEIQKTKF